MQSRTFQTCSFLIFLLSVQAAEETLKQRVVGLSEPSRADDLREVVKTLPDVKLESLDFESTEAAFRYDPAKLMSNFNPKTPPAPEAIAKRLNELLSSASHGTLTLKPPATLEKDKLKLEELNVGVLDCKGCRYGAYMAIAKLDGVEHASVDAKTSALKAWIDPAKTNRAALEAALKKSNVELPGAEKR